MPVEIGAGPIEGLTQLWKIPPGAKSPFQALPEEGFLTRWIAESFGKLFSPKTASVPKSSTPPIPTPKTSGSAPKISTGTKILGTTAAATTGIGILSLSPGGQNLTNVAGQNIAGFTRLGSDVTKFFSNNPLVVVGVVVIGGILVISLLKGGRK